MSRLLFLIGPDTDETMSRLLFLIGHRKEGNMAVIQYCTVVKRNAVFDFTVSRHNYNIVYRTWIVPVFGS